MTVANTYLKMYRRKCQFNHWFYCDCCLEYHQWVDNKPASAVYVSDDDRQRAMYICTECAVITEYEGDGPVFYG